MNKCCEYLQAQWLEHRRMIIAGNAHQAFDLWFLANSLRMEVYAIAVEAGLVNDQPEPLSWN